jgi:hypothetical protein
MKRPETRDWPPGSALSTSGATAAACISGLISVGIQRCGVDLSEARTSSGAAVRRAYRLTAASRRKEKRSRPRGRTTVECRVAWWLSHKSATTAVCCRSVQRRGCHPRLVRRAAEGSPPRPASSLGISPTPSTYATATMDRSGPPVTAAFYECRSSAASDAWPPGGFSSSDSAFGASWGLANPVAGRAAPRSGKADVSSRRSSSVSSVVP